MRTNMRQALTVGVFATFALLAAGSDRIGNSSSSGGSGGGKDDKKGKEPDVKVTAMKLFDDYHANEVSADNKYKGKRIALSGTVTDITKDFTDDVVLYLATSNEFMPVHATLEESEKSKAADLEKGKKIELICDGRGMVVGTPSLNHCLIGK